MLKDRRGNMNFNQWLSLYKKASLNETKVSLLNYLEQGNIIFYDDIIILPKNLQNKDIITSCLKRIYNANTTN